MPKRILECEDAPLATASGREGGQNVAANRFMSASISRISKRNKERIYIYHIPSSLYEEKEEEEEDNFCLPASDLCLLISLSLRL
jgi:hypothetical protein